MNKRKPCTPNTQSQGSSLESPAQVEATVNDYSAEIEELKSEIASLKKEIAEFKERIQKNSDNSGCADPRLDKLFEALKKSPNFFLTKELL